MTRPESRDRLLERLGGAAPVGLAAFDTEARFLTINSWMARMNGAPPAEFVGRGVREMLPDLADRIEAAVAEVIADRRPVYAVELSGNHKPFDDWRTAEATFFPLIGGVLLPRHHRRVVSRSLRRTNQTDRLRASPASSESSSGRDWPRRRRAV
ncbi:MAG: PAS domain-containing protein [Actinomycetota bacterium]